MDHIVLTNPLLHGFEYGMLRDFEDEILRLTGGRRVPAPTRALPRFLSTRLRHGTRYAALRRFVPRVPAKSELRGDVLWVILMGPEHFTLDLFDGWDRHVGFKILYIFDTMESQLPAIRRVLDCTRWDLAITSFAGARTFLEKNTGRVWHVVAQGVKLERFRPAKPAERLIAYGSYGRRLTSVHETLQRVAAETSRHYDYTVASALQPQIEPVESYRLYAWHLSHTLFNVSWPVELTHPARVRTFSPITCRWFEAAAAANVVIGMPPRDLTFDGLFGDGFVKPLDPAAGEDEVRDVLETLWSDRHALLEEALARRSALSPRWTWESRVREIMALVESASAAPARDQDA